MVNVNASALSGNSSGVGGAVFTDGTLYVSNSLLSGNSAVGSFVAGGAIFTFFGTATISNSILSDNSAAVGGAIADVVGAMTISNSALLNNTASIGGAIFNNAGTSTFSGNSPDNLVGGFNDLGGNTGLP
jgi:hypothetical protein